MQDIGFTGTRKGMTAPQRVVVEFILKFYSGVGCLHHGDCMGADAEAHRIAQNFDLRVFLHPPDNNSARAFCKNATYVGDPKPYLERNHDIVDYSVMLVAAPATTDEVKRSGTWATIRYALKEGKDVAIVDPEGRLRTKI